VPQAQVHVAPEVKSPIRRGARPLISGLNARMRTLNRRLEAVCAEAEAAVRTREEVLAVVAHDLKSLDDIEAGTRRMVGLIDELLNVAISRLVVHCS
jgi:Mg2+/Co2+ transporter CorB